MLATVVVVRVNPNFSPTLEERHGCQVALETGGAAPTGKLLRYGTSLEGPELPVSAEARKGGLGYTAPSNLHHWVGYAAVGYQMP